MWALLCQIPRSENARVWDKHRIIQTKPYKLINRKQTKTYGLEGLGAPLRQGRLLSLPTLPYQKANRYAVVGETPLAHTWTVISRPLSQTHI